MFSATVRPGVGGDTYEKNTPGPVTTIPPLREPARRSDTIAPAKYRPSLIQNISTDIRSDERDGHADDHLVSRRSAGRDDNRTTVAPPANLRVETADTDRGGQGNPVSTGFACGGPPIPIAPVSPRTRWSS